MRAVQRLWALVKHGDLQMIAASLSFSTLLSIIPFLAVSLATIQYINGIDAVYPKIEAFVLQYFQDPTGDRGIQIIQKVFARVQAGRMGAWGAFGLILASVFLINDMERALHRIWGLPSRRPFYQRLFFYWLFLILFPAGLAIYVTISSLRGFGLLTTIVPLPVLNVFVLFCVLYSIYKIVPNTPVQRKSALIGAALGTLGMVALFRSFKWISHSLFSWGKLYGSFAAFPALLVWILLIWYVILIGAAISSSYQGRETPSSIPPPTKGFTIESGRLK